MPAPDRIKQLVATFEQNIDIYHSQKNETELRRQFLDPFFEALGWDVDNKKGYDERNKEVAHEHSVEIDGQQKKADYAFRTARDSFDFLVEAKKPSVKVESNLDAAFQVRRYGWSAGIPINILTDFEHFAIYDCRTRPHYSKDKPATGRIDIIHYKDYVARWDEIVGLFSPEAIRKGALEKYKDDLKGKKGTQEVDDAFLEEIEAWREALARNIATRNKDKNLNEEQVNFAVQMTIDRVIFLRIAEERGMEKDRRLFELTEHEGIYKSLLEIFQQADARYNSGLFHFKKDKDRENPDMLSLALELDDKVLKDIIKDLYYPSPYAFNYIPTEILGSVYERFLGKVIRLTAGGNAKVEEKPEVRKAGGVYYTPAYIVEYIVKNTVGKLVEGKTPADVAQLKIVDPACGSGSFLLGAYQFLLDWHLDWYVKNDPEKSLKKKIILTEDNKTYRLSIDEKKRILLNNIHGVDLDSQAVEVTKLSLLLKVVEDPGQLKMFEEGHILPNLNRNIKNGNALIGSDYFSGQMFGDMEEMKHIKPFDWQGEFPEVFKRGGFDAVVGNPPWGAEFSDNELAYLRKRHQRVISRTIDSYIYLIDKSLLITNQKALVGVIIPSTILNQADSKPVRSVLLEHGLTHLISLGKDIFGKKVLNTSTIFISGKNKEDSILIQDLSQLPLAERKNLLGTQTPKEWQAWKELVEQDPHQTFFITDSGSVNILDRVRRSNILLQDILQGEIQRGISPDIAAAHVVSEREIANLESELLKPSISGSQIKRYLPWKIDQHLIYTNRSTDLKKYPKIAKWMEQFRHLNTCREVVDGKHPWYSLHRPRNPEIFNSPKFIGLTTAKTIELIYDEKDSIFVTDAMYVFSIKADYNPLVCMAVLSSKAFLFFYRIANQGESRVIPQVKAAKLYTLPYPKLNNKAQCDQMVAFVEQMLSLHKSLAAAKSPQESELLGRQIKSTDGKIDELVYKLYGLTEEEIKIVEG